MRHMFHALHGTSDQRQLSRRVWLLAALLLMLAACDAGVTTTGYEPLPPTNMPPLTGTAPAPTEPPPSILPDTQSILLPRGPLEAGTYVSVYMAPSFEFTIPEGFALKDEETDLVYLTKGPDQFPPDFAIFRVANQAVGITAAIPLFVVPVRDFLGCRQKGKRHLDVTLCPLDRIAAKLGMRLHDRPFVSRELAGF